MPRHAPVTRLVCEVVDARALRFDDGAPVRAASAVARLGDRWIVAQDDATHAAEIRADGRVVPLRLLDPVRGLDTFSESTGTKHLKPDLEAACEVTTADGQPAVLLLGSGSLPARMRGVVVEESGARVRSAGLAPLYARVATALGIDPADLNLEGVTPVEGGLRWFQRGVPARGVASASIDVDTDGLLAALTGTGEAAHVMLGSPRTYEVGAVDGHPLAVTDAVTLHDGTVLASAAAEDTPNAVDDGPVLGSVLALLDDDGGSDGAVTAAISDPSGHPVKVEGLAVVEDSGDLATVLAVVDSDDPAAPSLALTVRVRRAG